MDMEKYGPVRIFEVTWMSGHVERIPGHQVSWPNSLTFLPFESPAGQRQRIQIHGWIDGRWTLQLSALEEDIRTIRNLATEDALTTDVS